MKLGEMTEGETRVTMMMGGARSRSSQAGTQSAARMKAHGRVDGGRCHGGDLADETQETNDGDEADGSGALGSDGEQMGPGDTDGPGDRVGATATSVRGGAWVLED